MESYLMMLYVTLDQESALKTFFSQQGWAFLKPDLSVITDKLGPVISLSTQTPIPAQATCTFPAETDTVSTVPENTVHIVTEADRLSTVPENTIHIQLETLDQPDVKSRSSRKRSSKSDQTKPVAKLPRIKLQLSNTSGSAELAEKEQSEPIVQLENAGYEPVFVDDVNRIVVKEEAVDSDYEPDNDNVDDNENTDIDESFKQLSADNDASGSQDVTEGDGEQEDETGAGTEERRTQKQPKGWKVMKLDPNNPEKKGQRNPKGQIDAALNAYIENQNGGQNDSIRKIARKYGVCSTTLFNHIRSVSGKANCNVVCDQCSKGFSYNYQLRKHVEQDHTGVIPRFACTLCPKSFPYKSRLNHHMNVHNNEKPYSCKNNCGKSYFSPQSRYCHELQCKTEFPRPCQCPECGVTFKTRSALNRHLAAKHGEPQYVCECGQAFGWSNSMKRHKRSCKKIRGTALSEKSDAAHLERNIPENE